MLKLYKNIKDKRNELKMSQEVLANMVGYTDRSMIAKVEKGEVDLTQTKINAFAKALGTTPSELMGWDGIDKVKNEQLKRLISYYNSLNPTGQLKILDTIEDLSKIYGVDYIYDDGKNNFVIEVKGNNSLKAAHNDNETNQEEIENMNQDLDELND